MLATRTRARRGNPLVDGLRAMGSQDGVLSRLQRDRVFDALIRDMLDHDSQRDVLAWIASVATNRAGAKHSGNLALLGPRRCGKSTTALALAALLVALDGFVVRIMSNTLNAPTANFLETAKDGGLVARLQELGLSRHMTVDRAAGSVTAIKFSWGSELHVHDVGNERAIKKHHGITADLYMFDEAQHIDLLHKVIANLVAPTLADSRGVILLAGTPGDQTGSLFHRITTGNDAAYKVQRLATWHNPLFGDTPRARWLHVLATSVATARAQYSVTADDYARMQALTVVELGAIAEGAESGELVAWVKTLDGELLRQIFGRWATDGSKHVFAWHRVAASTLYYCSTEPATDTTALRTVSIDDSQGGEPNAPDMAACVAFLPTHDLDGDPLAGEWNAAIAIDIGYSRNPCSILVIAWSPLWPVAYEVYSNKWRYLADSAMLEKLQTSIDGARACGLRVGTVIADANGMRMGTQIEWDNILSQRYAGLDVGVRGPYKPAGYKEKRTHAVNIDIEQGRIKFVEGSPLDIEGRHLRFMVDKPDKVHKERVIHNADGTSETPGNDCLDDLLYCAEDIGHMLCDLNPSAPAPAISHTSQQQHDFLKALR